MDEGRPDSVVRFSHNLIIMSCYDLAGRDVGRDIFEVADCLIFAQV